MYRRNTKIMKPQYFWYQREAIKRSQLNKEYDF